ncbi:MAG: hypothetical protein OQK11_04130 [Thiovulaceae bacterium]|nr:hypothetical protein [Sulfurimonadaceae bacterium]
MKDFKLKMILSILSGVIFSFVFIILALSLPVREKTVQKQSNENILQQISGSIRK